MKKESATKKETTKKTTKKHQTQSEIIDGWRKVIQNM